MNGDREELASHATAGVGRPDQQEVTIEPPLDTTLPSQAEGIVFHHVEDVRDQQGHPLWSTGVSRLPSRTTSPSQLVASEAFFDNLEGSDSLVTEIPFNPAQIPHNLLPLDVPTQESRQIPMDEVLTHIADETSQSNTMIAPSNSAASQQLYEHQNAAENDNEQAQEQASIVEHKADFPETNSAEATMIIHDMDSPSRMGDDRVRHSTEELDDDFEALLGPTVSGASEQNAERTDRAMILDHSSLFASNLPESELFESIPASEPFASSSGDIAHDHTAPDKMDSMAPMNSFDIPDDLDEDEFNIETELDAEFAAMEASFSQNMTLSTADYGSKSSTSGFQHGNAQFLTKPETDRKSLNMREGFVSPYTPQPGNVAFESPIADNTLFTPAQISNSTAGPPANLYNPRSTAFSPPSTHFRQDLSAVKKSSTPSFVSGKAAYADPYALPDTLVKPTRARPQMQALRGAASVPNLKAVGQMPPPPPNQRHVSSAVIPQSVASSKTSMPPSNLQARSISSTSVLSASGYRPISQYHPQQPIQANSAMPHNAGSPHGDSSIRISDSSEQQNMLSMPRDQAQLRYTPQAQPYGTGQVNSIPDQYAPGRSDFSRPLPKTDNARTTTRSQLDPVQARYNPAAQSYNSLQARSNLQRGPSPLRQDQLDSVQAIMTGRPSPVHTENLAGEQKSGHERHESRASTTSFDSQGPHDAAFGDYLNQQRDAENRMFGDSYAIAEQEIYEAQSIQRSSGMVTPAETSPFVATFPRVAERPQSQPRPLPIKQKLPLGTYAPRSSLDEKAMTMGAMMSRTSSRAGETSYANTEPPQSPRQSHGSSNDLSGILPPRFDKRPVLTSRATSIHAYQVQPRMASPLPVVQNIHGFQNSAKHDGSHGVHPLARFGFGGRLVTSVPRTIPRFSAEGTMSHQVAGPGAVNLRTSKDLVPEDVLGDFPGPLLHGKSAIKQKKADLQLWLAQRVSPGNSTAQDDKTILYRLLMLQLEFNGSLESATAKERLISLLHPDLLPTSTSDDSANFRLAANISSPPVDDESQILVASSLTINSVQRLSDLLTRGDKDSALRYASDSGLWAHALLIASRISPQKWADVVLEFASAELRAGTEATESLKFLYKSFAGTTVHTGSSIADSFSTSNWRKSLTMILNNRGISDDAALISLGNSLLTKHQTYAAHFCFLLCSKPPIGPTDDPKSLLSVIGQQDLSGAGAYDPIEAIVMSEIYEFSVSLSQPKYLGLPHLLAYKLQRALLLSEAGDLAASKRYCEAITNALKALPKASNHLHHVLLNQLRDLSHRLDQSAGNEAGSWIGSKIAKPKMDNIWGTLEGKFSKFVAGDSDEVETRSDTSNKGPFAKLAQTPALSRVQSSADLYHRNSITSQTHNGGYDTEGLHPPVPHRGDQSSYPYANAEPAIPQNTMQPPMQPASWQPALNRSTTSLTSNSIPNRYSPVISRQGSYSAATSNQVYSIMNNAGKDYPYATPNTSAFAPPNSNQSYQPAVVDANQQHPNVSPFAHGQPYRDDTAAPKTSISDAAVAPQPLEPVEVVAVPALDSVASRPSASEDKDKQMEDEKPESKEAEPGEKKAGWLGGWFGGKKKETPSNKDGDVKVHKAKLGEGMSLVYDPVTKKWTNPKGTMPDDGKSAAPPPPMARKLPPSNGAPVQAAATVPSVSTSSPAPLNPAPKVNAAPSLSGSMRKPPNAEDDLAAMLGSGPAPRRAASASADGPPVASGSVRSKRAKPAKRYVDVFQEQA